jgi:peptidoglycan/LPS O-acetylase OafA/YrhL
MIEGKSVRDSRETNWVKGLDSIRFVLAMVVFLSHLQNQPAIFLKSFDNPILKTIGIGINHAYLGVGAVIAFFIISGFVIHYPFRNRQPNVKSFLVRRWFRIGLPLIAVVIFSLSIDQFYLIPIWSLYCELIYYTIYPLLRRLPLSWKTQFWISFVVAAVLIVSLSGDEFRSLLSQTNINYTGSYAERGDWLTWIVGLPCWLMGVLIAEKIDDIKANVSRVKIYSVRLLVWITAVVLVELKGNWFVSYIFTMNPFAFLVGYWLTLEIIFFRTHKPSGILEYAGKFSYSLYLIHGLCALVFTTLFGKTLASYPLIVFSTLLTSYVFYLLIELPSHRFSKFLATKTTAA